MAGVSAAHGVLMRQAEQNLAACTVGMLSAPVVVAPGSGPVADQVLPGACDVELLSRGGQLLTRRFPSAPALPAGRLLAGSAPGAAGHRAGDGNRVQLAGDRGGGSLSAAADLVLYGPDDVEYVIGGSAGHGAVGLLVVMTALAGIGQVTRRVAAPAKR